MTLQYEILKLYQKPLEHINEFSKVAGYKINIQKSVVFLYTNKKLSEREIKKIIPFAVTLKKKYLGVYLTNEVNESDWTIFSYHIQ